MSITHPDKTEFMSCPCRKYSSDLNIELLFKIVVKQTSFFFILDYQPLK